MNLTTAPTIHVSREAAERIRRHGGRLFLWQERVGSGTRDCLSVGGQPSGATFENVHLAKRDVEICIAVGLEPREIIVRERRWPFSGVRVNVDGKRWGWRGEVVSTPVG